MAGIGQPTVRRTYQGRLECAFSQLINVVSRPCLPLSLKFRLSSLLPLLQPLIRRRCQCGRLPLLLSPAAWLLLLLLRKRVAIG